MTRRGRLIAGLAGAILAVTTLRMPAQVMAPAPAQAPAKADAEFARRAYDTYRSMVQSSPYRLLSWQYLGPTDARRQRCR